MTDELQEVCNQMCRAHRHGSSLALLFDYDGTLTPIVEHPSLAVLDPATRQLLARLASRARVFVGILSGRGLDDLKSLVQIPGVCLSGTGGLELELRGARIVHPHADRMASVMARLAARLEDQLATYAGAWLEKKRLGLTVHYRQLADRLLGSFETAVTEVTRDFAGEVRIVQGPKALEITPARGWNKGTAVRLILADLGAPSDVLFYAGDGANDAEAMEEVAAMGGITVGIGDAAPRGVTWRVPSQASLVAFLAQLDACLEQRECHFSHASHDCRGPHGVRKSTLPTHRT